MKLPDAFTDACERLGASLTEHNLHVNVAAQTLTHFYGNTANTFTASTSKRGAGQKIDSLQTPLGLHRIVEKIGANEPIGTIFKGRRPIGTGGKGRSDAYITDRILWLAGLDAGFNLGGTVDSYDRYIYIHGVGDESNLGIPDSQGCIHLAATDLLPLFDVVPKGTLVFISEN